MSASDTIMGAFGIHESEVDALINNFDLDFVRADVLDLIEEGPLETLGYRINALLMQRAMDAALGSIDGAEREYIMRFFVLDERFGRIEYWPDGHEPDAILDESPDACEITCGDELEAVICQICEDRADTERQYNKNP